MKRINIWMITAMLAAVSAQATLLEFNFTDNGTDAFPGNYTTVENASVAYGKATSSATENVWLQDNADAWKLVEAAYTDGGVGWTPDVTMTWHSSIEHKIYDSGYGDLSDVIYLSSATTGNNEMWLYTAAGGDHAKLHSFDMATWGVAGATIDITVYAADGSTVLWSVNDASLGSGSDHVTFSPNVSDETVYINFSDVQGTAIGNVGIDNILFSQIVPEPATIGLLGLGGLAVMFVRKGKRS